MSNIKIQIAGETYEVRNTALRQPTSYNPNHRIYISHVEAGQLVKQFCKKFFPQYVCKVKSDSFSGGNSLDVYVCTKNGGAIPQHHFSKINEFANLWEYGKFNGMYDIYEDYENSGAKSDNGTVIEAGVKYVHVNNRACFGTTEAILNEVLNEGRPFDEVTRFYTDASSRPSVVKAKQILNIK